METFDIYKTNYINARLRYMNAKDMCHLLKEKVEKEHKSGDQKLLDRYEQEKWEAETKAIRNMRLKVPLF